MRNKRMMRIGAVVGVLAAAGLSVVGAGLGDPVPTGTPASPSTPQAGPAATIGEVAFLAGRWQGTMGRGSHVEEVWTNPSGNNVVGMFRWLKADGTPTVFELLTIQEEDGTLALRLRHQTASGTSWEEKDKPVTMRLAEKRENLALFTAYRDCGDLASCRYEVREGKLFIEVAFAQPSEQDAANGKKPRPALRFELERLPL